MRRWHLLALIFVVTALGAASNAGPDADAVPGGIRLLDGYQHERGHGEDTLVGRIWMGGGGLEIHYDIGRLAGNQAEAQEKAGPIWSRRQVVGDRHVTIVKAKDGRVFVSFASEKDDNRVDYPANFNAAVKGDEDLADLLLIVLTYRKGR